eukprot:TRINITY_DN3576_c0_g1_i5.p1 TRINITY_DN3576_c0_g1~~TRINITY_DN3576_c0_g1_i5.p1  ORF type:complete len:473 (+),score=55.91 TRINITY_DN3576_c0_g1_i5:69-1487(+)
MESSRDDQDPPKPSNYELKAMSSPALMRKDSKLTKKECQMLSLDDSPIKEQASFVQVVGGITSMDDSFQPRSKPGDSLFRGKALSDRLYGNLIYVTAFAGIGVILGVIENEVLYSNEGVWNWETTLLKIMITCTTILAEISLYFYYKTKGDAIRILQVGLVEETVIPGDILTQYLIEAVIIGVHPLPGLDSSVTFSGVTDGQVTYPWDSILGIAMISRVYLIYRMVKYLIGYHLKKAELIGKFNSVNITSSFAIKSVLHNKPFLILVTSLLINVFAFGYAVRLCERNVEDSPHEDYAETVWFMFVTIATIGYGDITAKTYCGRTVVIIGSVWGVVTTALLIGIVDQALKLSYSQMRVVNLLASDKWRSELRESAATVVQRIWRLRKMKHKPWHKKQRAITALYSWRKLRRKYQIFLDRCDNGSQVIYLTILTITRSATFCKIDDVQKHYHGTLSLYFAIQTPVGICKSHLCQ